MDRLDEFAVFVAILETGGLARAARRLGRSPAAVTRSLGALEARIGVRLIERSTRKLAPTDAGRRLAEQARRVLSSYAAATNAEAGGGPLRGRIGVTAPLVFGRRHVTPAMTAFLEMHPEVTVELVLSDRNLDLIDEQLDVAVRIGELADSSLVARRVGEVRLMTVASPDYLARAGSPQTPADLARHQIVQGAGRSAVPEWRYRGAGGQETAVRLAPRLSVSDVDAALMAVRDGQGIARPLSYQVADDLAAGRLVQVLAPFEPPSMPVHLVTPSARLMPARVRALLDHAARQISSLPVLQPAPA